MRWITEDQQSLNDEIPKGWYKMVQVRENGTAYWYVYLTCTLSHVIKRRIVAKISLWKKRWTFLILLV